jgi:hypothetical protein
MDIKNDTRIIRCRICEYDMVFLDSRVLLKSEVIISLSLKSIIFNLSLSVTKCIRLSNEDIWTLLSQRVHSHKMPAVVASLLPTPHRPKSSLPFTTRLLSFSVAVHRQVFKDLRMMPSKAIHIYFHQHSVRAEISSPANSSKDNHLLQVYFQPTYFKSSTISLHTNLISLPNFKYVLASQEKL